jgi:hypothetical protein
LVELEIDASPSPSSSPCNPTTPASSERGR